MRVRCGGGRAAICAAGWLALLGAGAAAEDAETGVNFEDAVRRFERVAREQLARGVLPGFSVAWVHEGRTVYRAGFGEADWEAGTPAAPDTVYRAGSISKLFNAVAAMQLVENGQLDLDAPVQDALPDFCIVVPFPDAGPITIRQLLCHRSGMIREAPVGGYLDPSEPTVAQTVASVASTVLVNPPNSRTRYSNVGPTIVGLAVEQKTGRPFEEYQARRVLEPLGMEGSAWRMNDALRPRLAKGRMRVARPDGSFVFETAPSFELGTIPAGNLYSTADDLAKFAAFLLSAGRERGPDPPILKRESMEAMVAPQLAGGAVGFGLGFSVNAYRGRKSISHSGAVYGFSSSLVALPNEQVAAVVLSNSDISMGPVRRLMEASLDLLLEATAGEAPEPDPPTVEPSAEELEQLVGEYESVSHWAQVWVENGAVRMNLSSQPLDLTPTEPLKFLAEGRVAAHEPVEFHRGKDGRIERFTMYGREHRRIDPASAPAAPAEWNDYVGAYGPRFIPLVVSIRHGRLYALVENEFDYRLTPINRAAFLLPSGMYDEEHVVFQRDASGRASSVLFANMELRRWEDEGAAGGGARSSLVSPDDAWTLWTAILAGTAGCIWLERTFSWAARIGGPVLLLGSAMLLSNLRVLPSSSPKVYDFVQGDLVQLALPLLLFRADVGRIVGSTGRLFLAFHLAALGTVAGAFAAAATLAPWTPSVDQVAGIMTASYIGGGINFFAVKASYGTSESVTNPLLVADNFIMAGMFAALMFGCTRPWLRRLYPHPHSQDAVDSRALAREHWKRKEISLLDLASSLAAAFVLVLAARTTAGLASGSLGAGPLAAIAGNVYVHVTGWSVAAATFGRDVLSRINGPEEIGSFLLYVFLFVIGLPANLYEVLVNAPVLFLFCLVMALVNLAATFGLGKLFRMNLEDLSLAVNATLGGPPSAAAMSIAMGWSRLVLPALLIGIWGYVIGTAIGLGVGEAVGRLWGSGG